MVFGRLAACLAGCSALGAAQVHKSSFEHGACPQGVCTARRARALMQSRSSARWQLLQGDTELVEMNSAGSDATCTICSKQDLNAMAAQTSTHLAAPSGDILLLTIGDANMFEKGGKYHTNAVAWGCYGNKHGIPVRAIDPQTVKGCNRYGHNSTQKGMWFFDRVCAMSTALSALQSDNGASELDINHAPRWVLHLDGDTMPYNGAFSVPELTKGWEGKDMVFMERFMNGEIAAANYALRVTQEAVAFMRGWVELADEGNFYFSNWDNGALHLQIVQYLSKELADPQGELTDFASVISKLHSHWRESSDVTTYDRFVALAKLALGRKRVFRNLMIHRRLHGFCQDSGLDDLLTDDEAKRFLCLHGEKEPERSHKGSLTPAGEDCIDSIKKCHVSLLDCRPRPTASNTSLHLLVRTDEPNRLGLGQLNDVGDCWPDCPEEIPEEQWKQLKQGLEANAHCDVNALKGQNWNRCCC